MIITKGRKQLSKSQDVRELFIETADRLFFEQGYDCVGVADICKAAGKAKGLFFYYFEKKENMAKLLAERQIKKLSEGLTYQLSQLDLSPAAQLNYVMNMMLSREGTGPRALGYFSQSGIPEWFDFYTHELKDRYIFPIIRNLALGIANENEATRISDQAIEIIYLGISAFMHRNFTQMADEHFYEKAISAIAVTLENALGLPHGSIVIK